MPVDPTAWPLLSQLMDEWLDLPEDRRSAWLAEQTARHPDRMPEFRQFFAAPPAGFLEDLPAVELHLENLASGALAGPYRLERELARGGMGVVWLATRADGTLTREVALKFPLQSIQGSIASGRFARERDILARLEDARIARLYDAGVTQSGQPYLALEYVEGEPITVYSEHHGLSLRERLELFLEIAGAVQYAHSNLIVHRDLKPSNILVTASRQVRLLDFGIAKLLESGETDLTRLGGNALTPGYASPEQIKGDPVTTATDIYSLGVLLYELLTGTRPERATDPVPPSAVPGDHARQLRGDLDAIVLKAIRAEPAARYPTADAFAQDIERYLSGLPVLARPENRWYRLGKFIRRNRLAAAASAIAVLCLTVGAGVAMWQARRADREAATARAVSDFLQNDLLAQAGSDHQANAARRVDPDLKVRTALDFAAARLPEKFKNQPAVEAAIRQTMGETYLQLGLFGAAQAVLEPAVALRRKALGDSAPDTLKTMATLASAFHRDGKFAQAEPLLQQIVDIAHRGRQQDSEGSIAAQHTLAQIAVEARADFPRGEALYTSLLETERRVLGESDPTRLATMNNLAALYSREGKYPQAEALYLKLIALKVAKEGPEHPSTLASRNGLGVLYRNEGKYAEAETVLQNVLDVRRRVLGPRHRDTAASLNALGSVYLAEGKYATAEPLLKLSFETSRDVLGPNSPDTQTSLGNLGALYRSQKKWKEARDAYASLLQSRLATFGPDNAFTAVTQTSLGDVLLQLGSFREAELVLRPAASYNQTHKIQTWRRDWTACLLGAALAGQGKRAEALPLLTDSYRNLQEKRNSIPPTDRWTLDQASTWVRKFSAK